MYLFSIIIRERKHKATSEIRLPCFVELESRHGSRQPQNSYLATQFLPRACPVLKFLLCCPPGVAPARTTCRCRTGAGSRLSPVGAVLRDSGPYGLGQWKAESLEGALDRPAIGHLLAPGGARRPYPRHHQNLRGAALGHARDVLPKATCGSPGSSRARTRPCVARGSWRRCDGRMSGKW